jgi:hypothetical protein
MNIEYTDHNTVVITMKRYLQEATDKSGLNIVRNATTPT